MNPGLRFFLGQLPDKVVANACTCGPVGHMGKAPGTNGSLLGIALYTVVFFNLGTLGELVLLVLLAGIAVLLCDEGERRLQKRDPGEIILDEVIAVPLCFLGMKPLMVETGHVWLYMLAGFGLFRLYDIVKPFGIKSLQRYPGGIGVVLDDLAAALAANLTLRLFVFAFTRGGW